MSTKQLNSPDILDLLEELKNDIFYSFNCHRLGIIEKFDIETQSASVQIVDKFVIETRQNKELIDFPLLVECPVFISKGSKGGLTYPIVKGDTCLVLFNDRDIDKWYQTGNIDAPSTARAHNIADGLVIPGFRNKINAISDFNNEEVRLNYNSTGQPADDSNLIIDDTSAKFKQKGGAEVNIDDKVEIKNLLSDMKTLMEKVTDAFTALVGQGGDGQPPITLPTEIAAITTEINNLLK